MDVSRVGDRYYVSGRYYIGFKPYDYKFIFKKEELRDLILNNMGIHSAYYISMNQECADSLGLKRRYVTIEDRYTELTGVNVSNYSIYGISRDKLKYVISYCCIYKYPKVKGYDGAVKQLFILDYLCQREDNEESKKYINLFDTYIKNQKASVDESLAFAFTPNECIILNNDKYVAFNARLEYMDTPWVFNEKKYESHYWINGHSGLMFVFTDDIINTCNMNEYEEFLFNNFHEFINGGDMSDVILQDKEKYKREICRPLDDKITYDEFMGAIKYVQKQLESMIYVDINS